MELLVTVEWTSFAPGCVALFALENEGDRLVLRSDDADKHGFVRGALVAREGREPEEKSRQDGSRNCSG